MYNGQRERDWMFNQDCRCGVLWNIWKKVGTKWVKFNEFFLMWMNIIILVILTSPKHMDIKVVHGKKTCTTCLKLGLFIKLFLDNIYCISFKLFLCNIKPMFQIVATHDYLANKGGFISPLGHTRRNLP